MDEIESLRSVKVGTNVHLECTFRDYRKLEQGTVAVLNDCYRL
jgi:hypothetical protein